MIPSRYRGIEKTQKEINAVLDKIKAEIESMDFDFGDYYDNTNEIIEKVCKVIDKYKVERSDNK